MTIFAVQRADILGDIKRKDHLIFALNAEGYHPYNANVGYNFVGEIGEDYHEKFKTVGENPVGTIITAEYDDAFLHGIVTHSINPGWEPENYETITASLDKLWEEHEDEVVRPFKSLWLGRGKMRTHGEIRGNVAYTMMSMANSQADIVVYIDGDDPDLVAH